MVKKFAVIGFLGAKLDQPIQKFAEQRWSAWRPSVSICQQEDIVVDKYELLHAPNEEKLLNTVTGDIRSTSPETDLQTHALKVKDPWDFEEVYASIHEFAINYTFDLEQFDYLIHITTGTHVQQICLFLLTESRHLPGKLLQTSPPRRKQRGNTGPGRFKQIDLDLSQYDAIASRFSLERKESLSYLKSGIETRNADFNRLIEQIEKVTLATNSPILLSGPTGAGKSQLAKRIYELKRNRQQLSGKLIEVNCATLRGDQAMATLFGHTKGAFTGATSARPGLLRSANKGMLFLDEIGELGADEQAMMLRAIEEKRFQPVGSDELTESDFQLIGGTNRDLKADVKSGKFREDLLARINLWDFRLPGLAERREDIEPNLDYELELFATRTGRRITINKEARLKFLKFANLPNSSWNANFRDLNAAVTRMGTLAESGRINVSDVKQEIERLETQWYSAEESPDVQIDLLKEVLNQPLDEIDRFDQLQLGQVIKVCRESKSLSDAGRRLYQVSRKSKKQPNDADRLRKYLAKFGIHWKNIN
jgi:transcriptional regulatory protein RtcR